MQTNMPGTLYIVATPIGNLGDVTERSLRVLREVDLIACEDTRHTGKLLNHFGIKSKTISYHEHNEHERADELSRMLDAGKSIAIVSDAGTPLISDPGSRVVNSAIEKGIAVVPVPGPTAFVAALVASGLPSDQFFFAGFLPARTGARRARLNELREFPATLIFYEAPHRIVATLAAACEVLGDREAALAREITKMHEEIARGRLSEVAQRFSKAEPPRGEMVLLIAGAKEGESDPTRSENQSQPTPERLLARVRELETEGFDPKAALKQAARELGLRRSEAYRAMVAQKNRRSR